MDDLDLGCHVGDVISMAGPTVPRDLWGKFFRVEAIEERGQIALSLPCHDAEMLVPYRPDFKTALEIARTTS